MDTTELGGAALALGSLLVVVLLYRDPASGFAAATQGIQSVLYFLVLPLLGLLAGVYVYLGGPYAGIPLFVLGTYLGVVGLGLTLGSLLATGPVGLPLLIGPLVLVLSLVALVASALRATSGLGLESLLPSVEEP